MTAAFIEAFSLQITEQYVVIWVIVGDIHYFKTLKGSGRPAEVTFRDRAIRRCTTKYSTKEIILVLRQYKL